MSVRLIYSTSIHNIYRMRVKFFPDMSALHQWLIDRVDNHESVKIVECTIVNKPESPETCKDFLDSLLSIRP